MGEWIVVQALAGANEVEILAGICERMNRAGLSLLRSSEAARMESFCASLEQAVIVSTAFAEASGQARRRLVSVGRYAMKGVAVPQELFTLDPVHTLTESSS
jgi:adenylate cyclase